MSGTKSYTEKMQNRKLKKRILDISFKKGLSHIGSCLTAVDIIYDIYKKKLQDEPFILSQGHAGLALYVVLEELIGLDAEVLYETMGTHPDRMEDKFGVIDCSTGSLGHGVGIGLGMALSNQQKKVWCLSSDGELAEGSVYEAANVMRKYYIDNYKVYVNWNGLGGYDESIARKKDFKDVFKIIDTSSVQNKFKSLKGLKGHYAKLNEADYYEALRVVS